MLDKKIFNSLTHHNLLNWMKDEHFLQVAYQIRMGEKLNLYPPKTFNEKLQWLKLYDRKPEYTMMVDKYEVKKYVTDIIGEEYIIPTIGVWNNFDEIDFSKLPDQFVLKCTHNSGGLVICRDKSQLNLDATKKKLNRSLKYNYYYHGREWPYKNVKPRIIAEQFMIDESGYELKDYKLFCFNGIPKLMYIATDRPYDTKFDFFDMDFNHLSFTNGYPNSERKFVPPQGFNRMKRLAEILSADIPHVRIDFYDIKGNIYFGEITFFHMSGLAPFEPYKWDNILGDWIELPKIKMTNT